MTALLGALSTRFSNADFVLAGRHLLGLGMATTIATQPCPRGATDDEHSDHAMACKQTAVMATLRHDFGLPPGVVPSVVQGALRMLLQRSGKVKERLQRETKVKRQGKATSVDPSYNNLLARG